MCVYLYACTRFCLFNLYVLWYRCRHVCLSFSCALSNSVITENRNLFNTIFLSKFTGNQLFIWMSKMLINSKKFQISSGYSCILLFSCYFFLSFLHFCVGFWILSVNMLVYVCTFNVFKKFGNFPISNSAPDILNRLVYKMAAKPSNLTLHSPLPMVWYWRQHFKNSYKRPVQLHKWCARHLQFISIQ